MDFNLLRVSMCFEFKVSPQCLALLMYLPQEGHLADPPLLPLDPIEVLLGLDLVTVVGLLLATYDRDVVVVVTTCLAILSHLPHCRMRVHLLDRHYCLSLHLCPVQPWL